MKTFDWYVFRNLAIAMMFISCTLAVVILLTQSLRFLELVIDSGASSMSFWILTILALPRFFEIIIPIALMAATIFNFNRMTMDSELVVIRAAGYSPMVLARPAIALALIMTVLLWGVTMWVAPKSLNNMQQMRQVIKAQFSNYLFREGVFNQAGNGLTIYIRKREDDGELRGLLIHDTRDTNKNPVTIMAKRGILIAQAETPQVLVFDGSRQEIDQESDALNRLNFERYTIDLPDSAPVRQRWQEPDERTINELLKPDMSNKRDVESLRDFRLEIHRRFASPILAFAYVMMASAALLLGPLDRRGQNKRIIAAILATIVIQGLFIVSFNLTRHSDFGLLLMYVVLIVPLVCSFFLLSGYGEKIRRSMFYPSRGPQS